MAVTLSDLKDSLKEIPYRNLTEGDDAVGLRAIESARVWLAGKLRQLGTVADETVDIVKQIIVKRALYELYSRVENEAIADDKRDDALELARAYYGPQIDGTGYDRAAQAVPEKTSAGAMSKPTRRRL